MWVCFTKSTSNTAPCQFESQHQYLTSTGPSDPRNTHRLDQMKPTDPGQFEVATVSYQHALDGWDIDLSYSSPMVLVNLCPLEDSGRMRIFRLS